MDTLAPSTVLDGGSAAIARAPIATSAAQADASVPETAVPDTTDDSARFRIVGRFVRTDGTPVQGVLLHLSASDGLDTKEVNKSSESTGRFVIAVEPRAFLRVDLLAEPAEECATRWQWSGADRARTEDLGDVTVYSGGTIAGQLLDDAGRPLTGQPWRIQVRQVAPGGGGTRRPYESQTVVDVSTGSFEVRGVPPFRTQIVADLDHTNRFEGPVVDVRSDDTTRVDLTCPVVGIRSRVTVKIAFPPFRDSAPPECAPVVLSRPGEPDREARGRAERVFDSVPPGPGTLTIDDPRFRPWRLDGVEPGSVAKANLIGNASVRLTVVAGASGLPVDEFDVSMELDDDPIYGQELRAQIYQARAVEPTHVLTGLLPIYQTLRIRAHGYADETIDLAPQPYEVVPIDVVLSRGATISGRVLLENKRVPEGPVEVRLLRKPRPTRGSPDLLAGERNARMTRSDARTGAFEFDRVSPGLYLLQASCSDAVHGPMREVEVESDGVCASADLQVPALAMLSGRVVGPSDASLTGLSIHAVPRDQSFTDSLTNRSYWLDRLPVPIASDGSYRIAALPAGPVDIRLRMPKWVTSGFLGSSSGHPRPIELGALDLEPGENRHDFTLVDSFPGTVHVRVRVDNEPPNGCVLVLWGDRTPYVHEEASHVFELEDSARIGPLPPGKYQIGIRPVEATWWWLAPEPFEIKNGSEITVECDVQLVHGCLQARFADSAECIRTGEVVLRPDSTFPRPWFQMPIDANGDVHLVLPPGNYTLGYSDDGRARRKGIAVPFAWPLPINSRVIVIPRGERVTPQRGSTGR